MESTNDKLQAELEKKSLNTQEYTASAGKTTYHDTTFGDPYGSLYTSGKWIFPGNIQP